MQELYDDPSLHMLLHSSCTATKYIQNSLGTTVILPAKTGGEKEIIFGKGEPSPTPDLFLDTNSDDEGP